MEVEMQDTSNLTLNKIQQAAIDEFLEKDLEELLYAKLLNMPG